MTWKFGTWFGFAFFFMFYTFLGVHYAHMKSPSQYRDIASQKPYVHLWYDASFKV